LDIHNVTTDQTRPPRHHASSAEPIVALHCIRMSPRAVPLVRRRVDDRCGRVLQDPRWAARRDIAAKFLTAILNLPQVRKFRPNVHFSVDGTLIEA
jgi:hypothetical protein